MSEITVYHLKACDSCRKALKALAAAGNDISAVDVRADGISENTLKELAVKVGWETLLNTRSTTWRGLDDSEKADMNEAKAVKLIAQHPTLMKRPVIQSDTQTTVGWKAAQQDVWL
jgi:Spx/MgsR family transcriptional regulator